MCLTVPCEVIRVDGDTALVARADAQFEVSLIFLNETVRPGDWIIGDGSGVVVIPQEHTEAVLAAAEDIIDREEKMAEAVRNGMSILDVMTNFNYERMLEEGRK